MNTPTSNRDEWTNTAELMANLALKGVDTSNDAWMTPTGRLIARAETVDEMRAALGITPRDGVSDQPGTAPT